MDYELLLVRVSASAEESLVGVTLDGRFQILGRVGQGGMGVVYRALQLSVGREVALKVIKKGLGSDAAARRLAAERLAGLPVTLATPLVLRALGDADTDVRLRAEDGLEPPEHAERAIYVVDGDVSVGGTIIAPQTVAIFEPGVPVTVNTTSAARIMAFGGAAMDGDRFISWNFVASSKELIENARDRWRAQHFPGVPGETEFIPLPEWKSAQ